MRHLKTGRKLNRTASHRKALFRNLAAALFNHESIKTTNPKALELRKVADRLITLAKGGSLHATRLAFAYLRDKDAVKKLFTDIGARYVDTNGGYTRVLKIGRRKGDAAPMAIIELTQKREQEETKEETKKAEAKKAGTKKAETKKAKTKKAEAKKAGTKKAEAKKEQKKKEAKKVEKKAENKEQKGRKAKEEKKD